VCVSEDLNSFQTEIQINLSSEPLFRKFIMHEINERKQIPETELINSGAEDVRISPVTAKRYLDKMCSERGILLRTKKIKTLVISYKPEIPYV